jgi:hypothetical protein
MPLIFGTLPVLKKRGPTVAISSIIAGFITFVSTKDIRLNSLALEVVFLPWFLQFVFLGRAAN